MSRHSSSAFSIYYNIRDDSGVKSFIDRDKKRFLDVVDELKSSTTMSILQKLFRSGTLTEIHEMDDVISFDHIGLFMASPEKMVLSWLDESRFQKPYQRFPSILVKNRLSQRYNKKMLLHSECRINILKAYVNNRQIEIFYPVVPPVVLPFEIIEQETVEENEFHYAFLPKTESYKAITLFKNTALKFGYREDGYGVNPAESTTTFYFKQNAPSFRRRLELLCIGTIHYPTMDIS